MKNFMRALSLVALVFGFSSATQAGDLGASDLSAVSPDNQPSLFGMQFAKASKAKKHDADNAGDTSVTAFDDSQFFIQLYGGMDFSSLGDIVNGTNAWISAAKAAGDTTSGGGNNSGIDAGALFGLRLDNMNSLALDFGGVFSSNNPWGAIGSGDTIVTNCTPTLLSVSADYILDFVHQHGLHVYATAGGGYYHTSVNYSLTETGGATAAANGTFTGDTIGGTLGLGGDIPLGDSIALGFFVKGRLATFSQVSSSSATALDGTGPSSLAILNASGYQVLVPLTNAGIASGGLGTARYATVDYTGLDTNLALNFYF